MKKITLSLLVVLFSLGSVFAQQAEVKEKKQMNPTERATKVANRLQAELGLSTEARDKVYDLNLTRFTELQKLRKDHAGDMKNHKSDMQQVRATYKAGLEEVLTPEQLAKLESKSAPKKQAPAQKKMESTPDM